MKKVTVKNVKKATDVKVAVEIEYAPALRVCVPTDSKSEIETARKLIYEKLQTWTKEEIIEWVIENEIDFHYSCEPYNKEYDED